MSVGEFGGDEDTAAGAEGGELGVFPQGRDGGEDLNDAAVGLEEHFLGAGCGGEVAFEREGSVAELGIALVGLVAVTVEAVSERERGGEGLEGLGGLLSVEGPGGHIAKPGEAVSAPVVGTGFVEVSEGGLDDAFIVRGGFDIEDAERVDGHEVGEVAMGFSEGLVGGDEESVFGCGGEGREFLESFSPEGGVVGELEF